jgi:hypothetical protein
VEVHLSYVCPALMVTVVSPLSVRMGATTAAAGATKGGGAAEDWSLTRGGGKGEGAAGQQAKRRNMTGDGSERLQQLSAGRSMPGCWRCS